MISNQDLSGQKFGKWLVIGKGKKPEHLKGADAYYDCQCECGTLRTVKAASLRSGNSMSCGCFQITNLLGQKFGNLTVVGEGFLDNHVVFYSCKCDCGTIKNIRLRDLSRTDGKEVKSCGCTKIHSVPEEARLSTARVVYRDTYNDGDLSFEKFLELSQLPCYYCNRQPTNISNIFKKRGSLFAKEHGNFVYNGLDRLDNSLPHNSNNVVPCCITCNWSKSKLNYKEFVTWITEVYTNLVKKKII